MGGRGCGIGKMPLDDVERKLRLDCGIELVIRLPVVLGGIDDPRALLDSGGDAEGSTEFEEIEVTADVTAPGNLLELGDAKGDPGVGLRSDPRLIIGGWLEVADAAELNRGFKIDATLITGD
jgi:hypothetical protein